MPQTRRGRPDRHRERDRRGRFVVACLDEAPTFAEAIKRSGISPAAVVKLLDELGLKPQIVTMLSDDPRLPETIAALRDGRCDEACAA